MRFFQLEIKGKKLFKKFLVPCNCLIGKFGFITATELTQRERERVNIISIYLTPPPPKVLHNPYTLPSKFELFNRRWLDLGAVWPDTDASRIYKFLRKAWLECRLKSGVLLLDQSCLSPTEELHDVLCKELFWQHGTHPSQLVSCNLFFFKHASNVVRPEWRCVCAFCSIRRFTELRIASWP